VGGPVPRVRTVQPKWDQQTKKWGPSCKFKLTRKKKRGCNQNTTTVSARFIARGGTPGISRRRKSGGWTRRVGSSAGGGKLDSKESQGPGVKGRADKVVVDRKTLGVWGGRKTTRTREMKGGSCWDKHRSGIIGLTEQIQNEQQGVNLHAQEREKKPQTKEGKGG